MYFIFILHYKNFILCPLPYQLSSSSCACLSISQAVLAQNQSQLIINAAAIKRQHFLQLFHLHSPHTHTHTYTHTHLTLR